MFSGATMGAENAMATPDNATRGAPRLADRLAAARRFVGRAAELELFEAALAAETPPFAALCIHGPGGVGKSSLLQQFSRLAAAAGRACALLDSRNIDLSPQGFLAALALSLGLEDPEATLEALGRAGRPVLLLDTYELLRPLDGWLRERFLPQLPAKSLVVIAGRTPLGPAWRSDTAWQDLVRIVSLRNLRPEESHAYLQQRGVPAARHDAVLSFTHGHPLALSLVADIAAQGSDVAFHPQQAPDVVATLLERFAQDVPGPAHRMALHASATARVLTEPLLREALGMEDVQPIFAWLRTLSFIEQGPFGLFPHDLAREVLDSDLRWRDPERYVELHRRVRSVIVRRMLEAQGLEQMRLMFDLVYLHRHNPILQPYFAWQTFGTVFAEPARPEEQAALLQRIAELSDEDTAALAEHWLERQPAAWHVIRDTSGQIAGVFMYLDLHLTSADERGRDPAAAYAWEYAQRQAPLRPGDEVTFGRFYVDRASYQEPTPALNTAQLTMGLRWLTSPRLVWSFTDLPEPERWYAMMSYYDFHRVADRRFGLYAHDWRTTPALDWIDKMGGRELATDLRVEELAAASAAPLLALSQPEFEEAVRAALRDYHETEALAASPLLRSRLVRDQARGASAAVALRELLRQGTAALKARPKEAKFARALEATYLSPAASQELAAERLGLPFGTYRYQLAQGIARLSAWLWQRELYGDEA
jgi:hypothetical protein